jgi:hypothetical protein
MQLTTIVPPGTCTTPPRVRKSVAKGGKLEQGPSNASSRVNGLGTDQRGLCKIVVMEVFGIASQVCIKCHSRFQHQDLAANGKLQAAAECAMR